MRPLLIRKSPADSPSLAPDSVFSWSQVGHKLGLSANGHLNIAALAVDRHAHSARADKTAFRFLGADGSTRNLKLEDFKVDVLDRWRSPHNNADYPMRWRLSIPSVGISIELTPRIKDQEMADISTVYWEGAVTLAGTSNGKTINGVGYVEMTGYQAGLNRRL